MRRTSPASGRAAAATGTGLPRAVWALGLVSLLMDTSSEAIHALLPVFLVGVLGAGTVALGAIEGLAEAVASLTKLLSGRLADRLARRKPLVLLGYGLAAATKPLFAMAGGIGTVLLARLLDRIGKGIRGAPRDALIADLVPSALRGRAYGLRQALDAVGAVAGPLLASGLMLLLAGDIRSVYLLATVPAILSVLVLARFVHEPPHPGPARTAARNGDLRADLGRLPPVFWLVLAAAGLGLVARLVEAFLILRLYDLGLGAGWTPLVLVAMNVVYALCAYPFGVLSDRLSRPVLLALAFGLLIAAHIGLAFATTIAVAFLAVGLYGLHLAASQGLLAAMVADAAPGDLRGTAFGLYHATAGLASLAAGLLAGGGWALVGAEGTFLLAATLALLALLLALAARPRSGGAAGQA